MRAVQPHAGVSVALGPVAVGAVPSAVYGAAGAPAPATRVVPAAARSSPPQGQAFDALP